MNFETPLVPATLIRRYKRFLADCRLDTGQQITAHCPNPGSMMGLANPGQRIWLEPNDDPRKKLKYGWRLVEHDNGHFTGVDTSVPNRMLRAALSARQVPELAEYNQVSSEVRYSKNSRVDFLLSEPGLPDTYVEVKSVTLSRQDGLAEFPDSVSARGAKHLVALSEMIERGHRAVMLYLVQRTDCRAFCLASDIDPKYAAAFDDARDAGVEVLVYTTIITPERIVLGQAVTEVNPHPLALSAQAH
ncbi:MAG: DNA/RNA nuclease SfsA [Pseudomonadota bacterium]